MTRDDIVESLALDLASGLILLHASQLVRVDKMLINKELFRWQNILIILAVAVVVHYIFGRWTGKSTNDSGAPAPV